MARPRNDTIEKFAAELAKETVVNVKRMIYHTPNSTIEPNIPRVRARMCRYVSLLCYLSIRYYVSSRMYARAREVME